MNQNQYSANTAVKPDRARPSNSSPAKDSRQPELPHSELHQAELHQAIDAILIHLRRESEFLDTVIECSLKMKDLLRRRSRSELRPSEEIQPSDEDGGEPQPLQTTPQDQLNSLRGDLARQFLPVQHGRQQMESALQHFSTMLSVPPTISRLAPKLDEPFQTQLKQLRIELKTKLHKVQAITMGNQAVLIYTMDHYQRLFNGMSDDCVTFNKAYNASGRMTNQSAAHTIGKNC